MTGDGATVHIEPNSQATALIGTQRPALGSCLRKDQQLCNGNRGQQHSGPAGRQEHPGDARAPPSTLDDNMPTDHASQTYDEPQQSREAVGDGAERLRRVTRHG
jgi:hypothetical protein